MIEYLPVRRSIGGLRIDARKSQSTGGPIRARVIPERLFVPLSSDRRQPDTLVSPGDRVLRGQPLTCAEPAAGTIAVHAPTSGVAGTIEMHPVVVGNALREVPCIAIASDGDDLPFDGGPARSWPVNRQAQISRLWSGGIAGLGGAAFPAAGKLTAAAAGATLVINGAECEPYISCDDMLMRTQATHIVRGSLIISDILGSQLCIVAIERDKPEALASVADAIRAHGDPRLRLAEIPSIYPAGGERQLIEFLTGEEIPWRGYPSEAGYVCHNVGTAYAIAHLATTGEPLISRVVTVTGDGIASPRNVEALIGTPIADLVDACGGYTDSVARLIVGGSMMGIALPHDGIPVSKSTNCVIGATASELGIPRPTEWPCIRCAECAIVCPVRLQPQELLSAGRRRNFDELARLGLDDCIECGACDLVCPSRIQLTQSFKLAKTASANAREAELRADSAQRRFAARNRRIRDQSELDRHRNSQLLEALGADNAEKRKAIIDAVERARRKRPSESDET